MIVQAAMGTFLVVGLLPMSQFGPYILEGVTRTVNPDRLALENFDVGMVEVSCFSSHLELP